MKDRVVNAMLVIASVVIALVLFEVGYRVYRFKKAPQDFIQEADNPQTYSFFNRSIWQFDAELGFRYDRSGPVIIGSLWDSRAAGCSFLKPEELGGLGSKDKWSEGAQLKVLVFGDSMTAITREGRSWPDHLAIELHRRTGKNVDVINMAMDGIGMLQMFDVAAAMIPKLQPDLAVVAFITDDLTRARIWRTVAEVNGQVRVFTSTRPDRTPDLKYAVDTVLLQPAVTMEWCRRSPAPHRSNDPLIQNLDLRYRLAVEQAGQRYDLYALNRSVFWERTLRRASFRHLAAPSTKSTSPRHTLARFSEDERMRRNVDTVKLAGTRVMLFHLATRLELKKGQEYVFGDEKAGDLLISLEQLTGVKTSTTTANAKIEPNAADAIAISKVDEHPSVHGMRVYASAVAEAIIRNSK